VVRLDDVNADGDYLDFGEIAVFANGLPGSSLTIAGDAEGLFIAAQGSNGILIARDMNGDGDALDFGEVVTYGQLPAGGPSPVFGGLAEAEGGGAYIAEATSGVLYHFLDLNSDGDGLDSGEALSVAIQLTGPTSIAVRPDGAILVAQQSAGAPVLILLDRNGDGDFLDFAEAINYAEPETPGQKIAAPADRVAYVLRPSDGRLLRLQDLTADDDALDFGEVVTFAEGLSSPGELGAVDSNQLFVTIGDGLYLLHDRNGDGDALDSGEFVAVGQGVTQPTGLAIAPSSCLLGDVDGNGAVEAGDIGPFANALLGLGPAESCRVDINRDGVQDGQDIAPFVSQLIP
jgi:hypothetical protein